MQQNTSPYNLQYWLLCVSFFFFFASFNMIIPELPGFLSNLGGAEYKGWIIALFTLTAGLSRPISGRLADTVGRKPVIIAGSVVCIICSSFYPFISLVSSFFLLRHMHGFSTGFTPTGTSAYLSDLIPADKMGAAMGILGFFSSLGMAFGPFLGGYVASWYSVDFMFSISVLFSVVSVAIVFGMKETLVQKQKFTWKLLKFTKDDIFEKRVLAPSVLMMLTVFGFGTVLTVIPDFSEFLGLKNKGLFFSVFTVSSLLVRIIAGRASDKWGRIIVLKIAITILIAALVALSLADSFATFMIAGVLFGIASGINSPTLLAWTVDLCNPALKGRAFATLYIAMEIGIGLGALVSGYLRGNDPEMFSVVFLIAAFFGLIALIYVFQQKSD